MYYSDEHCNLVKRFVSGLGFHFKFLSIHSSVSLFSTTCVKFEFLLLHFLPIWGSSIFSLPFPQGNLSLLEHPREQTILSTVGVSFGNPLVSLQRKGETNNDNTATDIHRIELIHSNSIEYDSDNSYKIQYRRTRSTDETNGEVIPTAADGARHGLLHELKLLKAIKTLSKYGGGGQDGGYPVAQPYAVPHPVPVPQPFPVAAPYAVPTPVEVPVPVYIPVKVPKPYAVHVPVGVPTPVHIAQPYSVPVPEYHPVPVAQPYKVPVAVPHPVPVAEPYSVPVGVPHPVPIPQPYPVPVGVPQPHPYPVPVGVPQPHPYPVPVGVQPYQAESHEHYHHHGDQGYQAPLYPQPAQPYSQSAAAYPTHTSYSSPQSYDSVTVTASNQQFSYRGAKHDHPSSESSSSVRFLERSDQGDDGAKTSSSVTFSSEKRKRSVPEDPTVEPEDQTVQVENQAAEVRCRLPTERTLHLPVSN